MIFCQRCFRAALRRFKQGRRTISGLSLLELVLGLGIFTAMAGSVYLIYTNAVRIESESRRLSDWSSESFWVLKAIEEDLGNMVPYRYLENNAGEERSLFAGTEGTITFVAETSEGLQWVSYRMEAEEAGTIRQTLIGRRQQKNEDQVLSEERIERSRQILTRKTASFKGVDVTDQDWTSSEIMTKNAQDLQFSYAGNVEGSELAWMDQWREPGAPAAVRVVLGLGHEHSPGLRLTKDILVPIGK